MRRGRTLLLNFIAIRTAHNASQKKLAAGRAFAHIFFFATHKATLKKG
jgi:hypothetical protein